MDLEAGDGRDHRILRHVERHIAGHGRREIGRSGEPAARQQHALQPEAAPRQHQPEHDLALDDEAPFAPHEIALADGAVGFEPRIFRIRDGKRRCQTGSLLRWASAPDVRECPAPMSPPLVHLKEIAHGFGGKRVLESAELAVGTGDRLCLVGRNGSGKSTLLKIAAGLVSRTGASASSIRQPPSAIWSRSRT